jgi:hypothetical protein
MSDEVGLLFSQVGYDLFAPIRVVVRGPEGFVPSGGELVVLQGETEVHRVPAGSWGLCWNTHWWCCDLTGKLPAGTYRLRLVAGGADLLEATGLTVGERLVHASTAAWVGFRQFEKRRIFGTVAPGWFDAGMLWMEVCSHATAIVGLCDLVMRSVSPLSPTDLTQTLEQVQNGCDYLGLCQDQAVRLGMGDAVVHDLAKAPERLSSSDVFMAALGWAKGAELLAETHPGKSMEYAERACRALDWIETRGEPVDPSQNMPWNQGFEPGQPWPTGWMTRYLMLALWAEILLKSLGHRDREDRILSLTNQLAARRVPVTAAEHGLYGHYYAYEGTQVTEKGWSHGMPPGKNGQVSEFGSDMGSVLAHPLHCFLEGLRLFPGHALAPRWREACEDFALHYFKPACQNNPFLLMPRGVYGKEGLLHFAGLWHGCNALYGQAAALGFEFAKLTGDAAFSDIACANLQWICGATWLPHAHPRRAYWTSAPSQHDPRRWRLQRRQLDHHQGLHLQWLLAWRAVHLRRAAPLLFGRTRLLHGRGLDHARWRLSDGPFTELGVREDTGPSLPRRQLGRVRPSSRSVSRSTSACS